jgi:hypothetical protein
MEYRGTEYTVVQGIGEHAWIWTVDLDERTTESGRRKTREAALTAVVQTVDRWLARKDQRQLSGIGT